MSTEAGLHTHTKKQKQQLGPSEPKTCLSTTAAEVGWRSPMGTHARHPTDRPKASADALPFYTYHCEKRDNEGGPTDTPARQASDTHTHLQRHDGQEKCT